MMVLLRGLVDLIAEEAEKNAAFSDRLNGLLETIPVREEAIKPKKARDNSAKIPDIYAENAVRSADDFLLWLRELPLDTLRSVIRLNDFDPTRRTTKWKDPEKLATFIADNLRARSARGSAFMTRTNG
ncbi:hypothetical protein SR870_14240 [Rhodopseudomonas palustris]|uniref:hypothetical protein n=1 Tax=Rhodopseudomonas palustris TaxID=1076 RepID=UPI002ACD8DF2|nr:hypothetical protein [Rhodopseudomonas palustris]WQG97868.1 hypothetical protein SR870_14240 [Rhodopseudomonas palustris]